MVARKQITVTQEKEFMAKTMKEKYEAAEALIASGTHTMQNACKEVGIAPATLYTWRSKSNKSDIKVTRIEAKPKKSFIRRSAVTGEETRFPVAFMTITELKNFGKGK